MNRKFCINYNRIINISSSYDLIINFSNRIHYKKEWDIKKMHAMATESPWQRKFSNKTIM